MHLRTILIGLNILLFMSGCGFLAWDEPDDKLTITVVNQTEESILIIANPKDNSVLKADWKDSISLKPQKSEIQFTFVKEDLGNDYNIELAVDFYRNFIINVNDTIVQKWEGGTPGYYGDSIHSPFNYDSWEIRPVESNPENVVGAVTFTITEEDLK